MNKLNDTIEYVFGWDAINCNPNGDMANDNRPREDSLTNKKEATDFRKKRFIRDYWISEGKKVLVQKRVDEKGNVLNCSKTVEKEILIPNKWNEKTSKDIIEAKVKEDYIDARIFGASITKPMISMHGPFQFEWSQSFHSSDTFGKRGICAFASSDDKEQATNWSCYKTPYVFFMSNARILAHEAQKSGVTEQDIKDLEEGFIYGLRQYRSTSKCQMPRFIVKVVYNNNKIKGRLSSYITPVYNVEDRELRNVSQISFNFSRLVEYYESKKESIKEVIIIKDDEVQIDTTTVHKDWKILEM